MNRREKTILKSNEKWILRDLEERKRKYKKNALSLAKTFNGKSPEMVLKDDEIKWKRPSKFG
jgi:hypothetical protein